MADKETEVRTLQLRNSLLTIQTILDPDRVMTILYANEIIEDADMQKIKINATQSEMVQSLIGVLIKKLKIPDAFEIFIDALIETGQKHIAAEIQTYGK